MRESTPTPTPTQSTPSPTIETVFESFLQAQELRLSRRTFLNYDSVIGLLTLYLNDYINCGLDAADQARIDQLRLAQMRPGPGSQVTVCEVLGPKYILVELSGFLNYFMPKKVYASKELTRAAGTVTKKLVKWLHDNGHVDSGAAADVVENVSESARAQRRAAEVLVLLQEVADRTNLGATDEVFEGEFIIARVEGGQLWLSDFLGDDEMGPLKLPAPVASRLEVDGTISGVIGQRRGRWVFGEVWEVSFS